MSGENKNKLAIAAIVFILLLKIITTYISSGRMWGISQLSYFDHWFSITFYILTIGIVLAFTSKQISDQISRLHFDIKAIINKIPRIIKLLFVAGIITILFHIWHDSVNLLGDSNLRIYSLDRYSLIPVFEPLDYLLHRISYDYIFQPLGLSKLECFRYLSYLAGFIFICVSWLFSRKLGKQGYDSALVFVYLLGWGGLMMFFGYAENYAFAGIAVLLFFYFAIDCFGASCKPLLILGLFLLAFFFHNLSIFLLPSLIYLAIAKSKKLGSGFVPGIIISLAVIFIWAFTQYTDGKGGIFILTESTSEPGYLLLGAAHLLDILNELLLISPMFLAMLLFQTRKRKKADYQQQVFFWIGAISAMLITFLIDPKLGAARDWDLFSVPLLAFHLALLIGIDWANSGKFFKTSIAVFSLAFTLSWVWLNANETSAINRYEDILKLDKSRSLYGYETLGSYYYKQEQWLKAERVFNKSVNIKPHFRHYLFLAASQEKMHKYHLAEKNYMKALELEPGQPQVLRNIGLFYFDTGRFEDARLYLDQYRTTSMGRGDEYVNDIYGKLINYLQEMNNNQP